MRLAESACPICFTHLPQPAKPTDSARDGTVYYCTRCGHFELAFEADANLRRSQTTLTAIDRAALSHSVRRMARSADANTAMIVAPLLDRLLERARLPNAAEQAESVVQLAGDESPAPGSSTRKPILALTAEIGALDEEGTRFILRELARRGVLTWQESADKVEVILTFDGWQKYEELQKGCTDSKTGFMAMSYSNETLANIFRDHFAPASLQAGFELVLLRDKPRAGSIDAHLQNEIRTARFLVADLTDENAGAYWEAGFATGLGKPVIYTCEKRKFKRVRTHFDTEHFHTVFWDAEIPAEAAQKLKDTIRATLPGDAKLRDD